MCACVLPCAGPLRSPAALTVSSLVLGRSDTPLTSLRVAAQERRDQPSPRPPRVTVRPSWAFRGAAGAQAWSAREGGGAGRTWETQYWF